MVHPARVENQELCCRGTFFQTLEDLGQRQTAILQVRRIKAFTEQVEPASAANDFSAQPDNQHVPLAHVAAVGPLKR